MGEIFNPKRVHRPPVGCKVKEISESRHVKNVPAESGKSIEGDVDLQSNKSSKESFVTSQEKKKLTVEAPVHSQAAEDENRKKVPVEQNGENGQVLANELRAGEEKEEEEAPNRAIGREEEVVPLNVATGTVPDELKDENVSADDCLRNMKVCVQEAL